MLHLILIFIVTCVIYSMFKYVYIFVSKKLKSYAKTRDNYIVNNVLLADQQKLNFIDFVLIIGITLLY